MNRTRLSKAFTLIELLIVISIMAILLTLAALAAGDMINSIRMRDAIETVRSQFESARQTASTQNTAVLIRIYREPDEFGNLQWSAIEFGTADLDLDPDSPDFQNPEAPNFEIPIKSLGPIQRLPESHVFHPSTTYSTLLSGTAPLQSGTFRGVDNVDRPYISFVFLPDGRTNLPTTTNWTLTIVKAQDLLVSPTALPSNYTTLELAPTTSRLRTYRP